MRFKNKTAPFGGVSHPRVIKIKIFCPRNKKILQTYVEKTQARQYFTKEGALQMVADQVMPLIDDKISNHHYGPTIIYGKKEILVLVKWDDKNFPLGDAEYEAFLAALEDSEQEEPAEGASLAVPSSGEEEVSNGEEVVEG